MLEDGLASHRNIITKGPATFAWIGDLVTDLNNSFFEGFLDRLTCLQDVVHTGNVSPHTSAFFEGLNGAFAIIFADAKGFCIVTDPLGCTMVYMGKNKHNKVLAFGTQPDLVATITDDYFTTDFVSVAEFLNCGCCSFPNTMHANVEEMKPGRVHIVRISVNAKITTANSVYWSPPKETSSFGSEKELAGELQSILLAAVRDRCKGKRKIGVFLSGGDDSRLVMAAVPERLECLGLTFSDCHNRETHTAKRVAKCYNRDWVLFLREKDFLANTIVDTVKLTGCEFDWVDAHAMGFVDEITKLGSDAILNGLLFDMYLKALYAFDIFKVKRLGGILPATYRKKAFDYVDNLNNFWKQHLDVDIVTRLYERRESCYKDNVDPSRSSSIEWLSLYPFSQDPMAEWAAERRLLPIRLVAADRRLLDFAFRCPFELKLGKKIFTRAAMDIYGAGSQIPNAGNGVRPGSGHWSRLAQRAVRRFQDEAMAISEKLGRERKIQHSWHDYQKYWGESKKMSQLALEHRTMLDAFDGIVFKQRGRDLLTREELYWRHGFRLLQLAVWENIKQTYRA